VTLNNRMYPDTVELDPLLSEYCDIWCALADMILPLMSNEDLANHARCTELWYEILLIFLNTINSHVQRFLHASFQVRPCSR
jgi:hypothetical protein